MTGRLRNFVISSPGRYIRAWMRAAAPANLPVLRLGFITQERLSGGARFRLRYGRTREGEPPSIPARAIEATLKLNGAQPGREIVVEMPLAGIVAGDELLMTLERDSLDREDTIEAGVRLVSATLAAGRAR
jgi:hypothetical protein